MIALQTIGCMPLACSLEARGQPVTEPTYPNTLLLIACSSRILLRRTRRALWWRLIRSAKDLWRMAEPHASWLFLLAVAFPTNLPYFTPSWGRGLIDWLDGNLIIRLD